MSSPQEKPNRIEAAGLRDYAPVFGQPLEPSSSPQARAAFAFVDAFIEHWKAKVIAKRIAQAVRDAASPGPAYLELLRRAERVIIETRADFEEEEKALRLVMQTEK